MTDLTQTDAPAEPKWHLVRREVDVRATADGGYRVEAWLDLAPPDGVHASIAPATVTFVFDGHPDAQALALRTLTINGERPVRTLVAKQRDRTPRGTIVGARIAEALRERPWFVHLVVDVRAEAGRVAIPRYDGPQGTPTGTSSIGLDGAAVDGALDHASIVVDPWRVAVPWLVGAGGAVVLATAWIIRRRIARGSR